MHCYNCGKEITETDKATTLDDLNWSHDECLWENSEFVVDPFDTYENSELPVKPVADVPKQKQSSAPIHTQANL